MTALQTRLCAALDNLESEDKARTSSSTSTRLAAPVTAGLAIYEHHAVHQTLGCGDLHRHGPRPWARCSAGGARGQAIFTPQLPRHDPSGTRRGQKDGSLTSKFGPRRWSASNTSSTVFWSTHTGKDVDTVTKDTDRDVLHGDAEGAKKLRFDRQNDFVDSYYKRYRVWFAGLHASSSVVCLTIGSTILINNPHADGVALDGCAVLPDSDLLKDFCRS